MKEDINKEKNMPKNMHNMQKMCKKYAKNDQKL